MTDTEQELLRRLEEAERRIDDLTSQLSSVSGSVSALGSASVSTKVVAQMREGRTPFEVFYDEESDKTYIYAPDGCVLVDGEPATISNSEDGFVELSISDDASAVYAHVDADGNVTFDENETSEEEDLDEDTDDDSGGETDDDSDEEEEDGDTYDFKVCVFGNPDDDAFSYNLCSSVVNLGSKSASVETDDVSVDRIDDEESEKDGALEIAHFADEEMNSGKGLVDRLALKADTETGEITSSSTSDTLELVCRKEGKVIYVPLNGSGSDPEEEDEPEEDEDCQHDDEGGNNGGVKADEDDGHTGGGSVGPDSSGGGVVADGGETHVGDSDCCNHS